MIKLFKNNQSALIVLIIVSLFLLSAVTLSFVSKKYTDPDYKKDWWVLSFENPKDKSLNFSIENHSTKNSFHYEISDGQNKLSEKDLIIENGGTKKIEVSADATNKKITISVTNGENKKEIYKNL